MHVLLWLIEGDILVTGARVLAEQTSRHLQELGVQTTLSWEHEPNLQGYDLVHALGAPPIALRRARQAGVPLVMSTIYHRNEIFPAEQVRSPSETMRFRSRMGLVLLRSALQGGYTAKCAALVHSLHDLRIRCEMSDVLLSSSQQEIDDLRRDLGITTPFNLVPNGVDPQQFSMRNEESVGIVPAGVLYAGRFEPSKNQLGFIRAMRGSAVPVTLVGPPHRDHVAYYEQCRREAAGNITLLPPVAEQADLAKLYRAVRVHALPSWFETTGLVSLEAALCGCNIVSTSRGYAREYLRDMAWYCDPANPTSIRRAVEDAHAAPVRTELKEHILKHFTWAQTVQATVDAYNRALSFYGRSTPSSEPGKPNGEAGDA